MNQIRRNGKEEQNRKYLPKLASGEQVVALDMSEPAAGTHDVGLKVSEKGGVSVYGLGRFPVTLYKEQWAKLLAMSDEIKAFIKENDAKLKAKE